jgi:hypothetical protein
VRGYGTMAPCVGPPVDRLAVWSEHLETACEPPRARGRVLCCALDLCHKYILYLYLYLYLWRVSAAGACSLLVGGAVMTAWGLACSELLAVGHVVFGRQGSGERHYGPLVS